jgi:hypothetical protein
LEASFKAMGDNLGVLREMVYSQEGLIRENWKLRMSRSLQSESILEVGLRNFSNFNPLFLSNLFCLVLTL